MFDMCAASVVRTKQHTQYTHTEEYIGRVNAILSDGTSTVLDGATRYAASQLTDIHCSALDISMVQILHTKKNELIVLI